MQIKGEHVTHSSSGQHNRIQQLIGHIFYGFQLLLGLMRTQYHCCPYCNNDAPVVYDCPVCEGWDFHHRLKTPTRELERAWWQRFKKKLKEDNYIG